MRKILLPLILACIALCVTACSGKEEYGLCIFSSEGTAGINEGRFYPMHSVVKFPQALYVADYMETKGTPMLEMMGEEGVFSFRELLRLSLVESDNNACDLLFNLFGMPEKIESFMKEPIIGFGKLLHSIGNGPPAAMVQRS